MLKLDYFKSFNRIDYYKKISETYFYIRTKKDDKDIVRDEFIFNGQNIFGESQKIVTREVLFDKYKEIKKDNFHEIFKDISFKCLLIGNFRVVQKIKNRIGTNQNIKNNKSIQFIFNYTNLQNKIKIFFENKNYINVSTCYYCNIDYVNSYNTRSKTKNKFTLDHYYDKATYPYLALSFFNLVPSCYTCNSKLKKTEEFSNISPSSKNFNFYKKVKFKLFFKENCKDFNVKSKEDIEIPLKERYSNEYDKYIEVFKLNERYQAHKDIVFEMIQNVKLYPESRLKELQELTGIPYQQIKKDIFNLIDEDTDLSKEPFSKLIKDISKELGLLP